MKRWSHDVDILVPDLETALKQLKEKGWVIQPVDQGPHKKLVIKGSLIQVSVHERVSWDGIELMDNGLNWQTTEKVVFEGVFFKIPSTVFVFFVSTL